MCLRIHDEEALAQWIVLHDLGGARVPNSRVVATEEREVDLQIRISAGHLAPAKAGETLPNVAAQAAAKSARGPVPKRIVVLRCYKETGDGTEPNMDFLLQQIAASLCQPVAGVAGI